MIENLFICWAIVTGAFCLLAICHFVGLGVMRLRDRRTGKMGYYVIRRER